MNETYSAMKYITCRSIMIIVKVSEFAHFTSLGNSIDVVLQSNNCIVHVYMLAYVYNQCCIPIKGVVELLGKKSLHERRSLNTIVCKNMTWENLKYPCVSVFRQCRVDI